jgi:hypothetical protein
MGIRRGLVMTVAVVLAGTLAGCSDDDDASRPRAERTTDSDCARVIPDDVFTTLGWTPTAEGATATVRGCHREAEQGYVEVRERTGYDRLCATLDRAGEVGPGAPVDWLGDDVTACAVEPTAEVGQTWVVVRGDGAGDGDGDGDEVTQVSVVVLTATGRDRVRAAVAELVG